MRDLLFYAAVSGLCINFGRLLDIAWPTKFLPWQAYVLMGLMWLGVLVCTG
jgi:hypothetical protein